MGEDDAPRPEQAGPALLGVGAILRQHREEQGRTLEDIAEATRIRMVYLAALEAGELRSLPGEVFIKGFLRAYGNELGLNGDRIVEDYKRGSSASGTATGVVPRQRPIRPIRRARHQTGAVRARNRRRRVRAVALIVILIALVAVIAHALAGNHGPRPAGTSSSRSTPSSSTAASTSASSAATIAASSSAAATPVGVQVAWSTNAQKARQATFTISGASSIDVVVRDTGLCWIERWVGTQVVAPSDFLYPGHSYTWTSTQPMTVEIGNPGGIALTVNGIAGPALSGSLPEWLVFQLTAS